MSLSLNCFGGRYDGSIVHRSDIDLVSKSKSFQIKNTGFQREVKTSMRPNLEYYDLRLIKYQNEFKEVLIKRNDTIAKHADAIKNVWDELDPIGFDLD